MANEFQSKFKNEFIITDILGFGAFGCVFEAENQLDEWKYAVKRIAVDATNATTFDKALKEVRAMAQLDHPGIIRYNSTWVEQPPPGWQRVEDRRILRDIDWWNGSLSSYEENSAFIYIQMQLCFKSLDAWLEENGNQSSRSPPRMMSWFKQMVSAVAYIHKKGLIHRDLKPCNILLVDEETLKICDLGIATERVVIGEEEIAIPRTSIGTEPYMSPEQRAGRPIYSSKTDVFTLGLILAELCVAMTLEQRWMVFKQCRRGKPSDLISDPTTAALVGMLTKKNPADRPTCEEILVKMFNA